jgi:hypothetical protein
MALVVIEENDLRRMIREEFNKAVSPMSNSIHQLAVQLETNDDLLTPLYLLENYKLSYYVQATMRKEGLPWEIKGKRKIFYSKLKLKKFMQASNKYSHIQI